MFTLTVYRGDRIVQELDLEGAEIAIGRNADNQVVLPDDGKGVSRVHAVLRDENGAYVLSDRNSQNGTFLEGKRIKQAVVQPGQDIVIGPFRLVLSPREADADPGSTGTVVASRSAAPVVPPIAQREATPRRATPTPTVNKGTSASQTAKAVHGTVSAKHRISQQSPSILYGIGALVVALLATVLWQFWPASPPETVVVSQTTTTTIPATTSIPEVVDLHAQAIAEAETRFTAAETAFGEKRYAAAATAFEDIAKLISPVLDTDAQHAPALDLQNRAKARAADARRLDSASKLPPPTIAPVDLRAVFPRPGESALDYDRRNKVAQQDYEYGKRLLNEGDLLAAVKVFEGLVTREPGWLDVSTYLKKSQDDLGRAREESLNDGLRLENTGFDALNARRFVEAANAFTAASQAFDRAASLQAPTAEKMRAENLARRHQLAKAALQSARTHANNRNRAEATKLFQVVVDVLPPGDALRLEAESDLKKLGPGDE